MQNKYQSMGAIVLVMAMVFAFAVTPVVSVDASDMDPSITVVDGKGNTVSFDKVPDHIITIGKGVTATAIEIGVLDKILVCDSYSAKASEDVYSTLKEKVAAGTIKANGTVYSSGKAALITDIVDAADIEKMGKFDKTSDAVFITGSDTYITGIIETLNEYGFTKILAWNDIVDYKDIAEFIKTVSIVSKGTVDPAVEKMVSLTDVITTKLVSKEKRDAFYVTYSGGTFKVGNTGSLANSMIIAAGGNSVTVDSSKTGSTYEANITELREKYPTAVIFIDNSINSNVANLDNLRTQLGGNLDDVVPLNSLWNNYCVESMDGVWTMACAMYPDVFGGDTPATEDSKDDSMIYIVAVIVAIAVIGVVGFLYIRKN
ncbi:MAG: hypothetical protein MJZ68_08965 [archaeon]|nr:hypothetical protein [archaeon]